METMYGPRLFDVTRPLHCESPISWAQRVCQQYDLTFSKLLACFGHEAHDRASVKTDIDLALRPTHYANVARVCGLPESDFALMRRCMAIVNVRKHVGRQKKGPHYRYCPECWRSEDVPYLRLEWRFPLWRICPAHRIKLKDACPGCHEPLQMQRAVLGGSRAPRPVASLAHCLMCGADMRLARPDDVEAEGESLDILIANQRAHISALFHGYFNVVGFGAKRFKSTHLTRWIELGVLSAANGGSRAVVRRELPMDASGDAVEPALMGGPLVARQASTRSALGDWIDSYYERSRPARPEHSTAGDRAI